jgi:hypothetical protein
VTRPRWQVTAVFSSPDSLERALALSHRYPSTALHAYSPFPLDHAPDGGGTGVRTTLVATLAGIAGAAGAVWFQTWVMGTSWPMNIGGRPSFPGPAMVPVAFEIGVLAAGMAALLHFLLSAIRRRWNSPCPDHFLLVAEFREPETARRLERELGELGPQSLEVQERWAG